MGLLGSTFTSTTIRGNKRLLTNEQDSDPGNDLETISATVPPGQKWFLYGVTIDFRHTSATGILKDSTLIGSCRTGAGQYQGDFSYPLPYELEAGDTISINFHAHASSPVSTVRSYVHYLETTA